MRIVKLTPRIEKWLLTRRAKQDDEAQSVAAEIVADVRKRGDAALFAWTKKLDHLDLARQGVWISKKEIRSAERHASSEFLNAVKRAAKNVRSVAEKQLPRPWSFETEPGVRISQRISPI
jgi:histidinol dehydrogenase